MRLRKLAGAWNDRGEGDYALWYVRDNEKREVDFLITERRRPYALFEAKLTDQRVSPALAYFQEPLAAKHAVQIVRRGKARNERGVLVLPADRILAQR